MSSWIKVVRYHLAERKFYVWAPWALMAFVFIVNLVITLIQGGPNPTKALISIYAVFLFVGAMSISRSLPFGLTLGISRRSYYTATALVAGVLAALYGLMLAFLQAIERASGGWWVTMHFFQVAYVFAGPWYLTWLSSFVGLSLSFIYGMCFAIVYRHWHLPGVAVYLIIQATVVLAGTRSENINHFFTHLSATGLTGVLAALAAALLVGGYASIRRVSV